MPSSVSELLSQFGSPLYVYDLRVVRARARALAQAVPYRPFQPLYAVKANPCPAVVRTIVAEGYGVDAVSPGEVALALRAGVAPERILYTENNMTDGEMRCAMGQGVVINCGSLDRLRRLAEAGGTTAAVRFNPDVGAGAHEKICTGGPLTKFGVHHSQVEDVLAIERNSTLRVIGCHMHIGSGILDAAVYAQAMQVIRTIAIRLPHLRFVDVGGGLGIPYKPEDTPIDLTAVATAANALMRDISASVGRPIELRLEPGRFLVAEAGTLYTTVTSVKVNPDGRCFVGCDSGFNHLVRPTMYGSYHPITVLGGEGRPLGKVDVVGNICESGDIFARDRMLPQPQLGDVLAIGCAGAYGMAMASTYNIRPLPAEVVVDGESVLLARPAQRVEDLLAQWQWE